MAILSVTFFSRTLFRTVPITVILPSDKMLPGRGAYQASRQYKTLYLLHGLMGSTTDWLNGTRIQALATAKDLCVIMPSGDNKFYADSKRTGDYYGKFITEDLITFAENSFPLSHKREDRFLAGLSMGGFGALTNGLRHPEKYGYIAAMSSALIKHLILGSTNKDTSDFFTRKAYENMFDLERVEDFVGSECDYDFLAQRAAALSAKPSIFLSCGTEDALLPYTRAYRDLLLTLGYTLHYEESRGNHNWLYWDHAIEQVLNWLPLEENEAAISSENVQR